MTNLYGSNPYPDPQGGGPPHYGPPAPYVPPPPGYPPRTNGMAVASLVLSLVALPFVCLYGSGLLLAVLGVIFGHVAKAQIRRDGTQGDGMATAGLAIGYVVAGLELAGVVLVLLFMGSLVGIPALTH